MTDFASVIEASIKKGINMAFLVGDEEGAVFAKT